MGLSDRPAPPRGGLEELRRRLGVNVEGGLLETALTHVSYANDFPEDAPGGSNERLEFLGDAVLQLLVGELLVRRFPRASAGELTRLRAAVVSEQALWPVAERLGLGRLLRLGRGGEATGSRSLPSLLADTFEAVAGAVYLGAGVREARKFVSRYLGPLAAAASSGPLVDAKTALQERAQAVGLSVRYRVVGENGPPHRRVFEVEVWVGDRLAGRGTGRSKKEAEQAAAVEALAGGAPGGTAGGWGAGRGPVPPGGSAGGIERDGQPTTGGSGRTPV